MSVGIFLIVIFLLILVHEIGHFVVAKKVGMCVDEFGIGFPPKLFSLRKKDTEYSLNLFPIGGFVKIRGDDLREIENQSSQKGTFASGSKSAQILVLIAGVIMNILFAWVLFFVVFMMGFDTVVVSEDDMNHTQARLVVTSVVPGSPAAGAGIEAGFVVNGLSHKENSISALTPSAVNDFVTKAESAITLSHEHGVAQLTPVKGLIASAPEKRAVGISLALIETISFAPHIALWEATKTTISSLFHITVGVGTFITSVFLLQADFSDVAGPVGIIGLINHATGFGLSNLIIFTAIISLNLAVINLLPIPALDGGRLLFVLIEIVKGSPVPARYANVVNSIGILLLLALMLMVTIQDVMKIL